MNNSLKFAKEIQIQWAKEITNWEKTNGRKFSWRENRTPYRILIAEVLLKRTTSTAAIRLYEDFLKFYPDIRSLYKASLSELESTIRPIGLYKQRSKHLKQLATYVEEDLNGLLPSDYQSLTKIPGIGEYTASAIVCFSYGKRKSIVDSNVERILSRVFSVRGKDIKTLAEILVDKYEPDVYNYGLLDLGFLICRYNHPKCLECPVNHLCDFFESEVK